MGLGGKKLRTKQLATIGMVSNRKKRHAKFKKKRAQSRDRPSPFVCGGWILKIAAAVAACTASVAGLRLVD
jgi:hypothetical protein